MEARQYALAVHALWRARRAWHRLDQAMVDARQTVPHDPHLEAAWQALTVLDHQLGRLAKLLT